MNGNDRFPQLFWGLALMAVSFVIVGLVVAGAVRAAKRSGDSITVTGSARRPIRSDRVVWSCSVSSLSMNQAEGYDVLKARSERVQSYLRQHSVPDSELAVSGVHAEQIFHSHTAEFIGYKTEQRFTVTSGRVDSVDALSRQITELTREAIDFNSDTPQFYYTRMADLRIQMLSEATKDAKTRAETIAQNAGGKIGGLRNSRMGVFQITAPNSRDVRDYGMYDTSTIDKDITAVVTVTFSVE